MKNTLTLAFLSFRFDFNYNVLVVNKSELSFYILSQFCEVSEKFQILYDQPCHVIKVLNFVRLVTVVI